MTHKKNNIFLVQKVKRFSLMITFLFAAVLSNAQTINVGVLPSSGQVSSRSVSFEYDETGKVAKEFVEPDSPELCLQTYHAYDGLGNKISTASAPCAGASSTTLSSANQPRFAKANYSAYTVTINSTTPITVNAGTVQTQTENALGQKVYQLKDPRFGGVIFEMGSNGLTITREYDTFGMVTKQTRADGTYSIYGKGYCSTNVTFCPAPIGGAKPVTFQKEQIFGANGIALSDVKVEFYDALGRKIRSQAVNFAGQLLVQDTEYDQLGRVKRTSSGYVPGVTSPQWTVLTYDLLDRIVKTEFPVKNATTGLIAVKSSFNSYSGLKSTVTNSLNQTKTIYKGIHGKVASVIDAAGNKLDYKYDTLGNLVQTTASGTAGSVNDGTSVPSITKMEFDKRGRKTKLIDPAMGIWTYKYNAFGELVQQQDSLGQVTTLSYDELGRLIKRIEPDLISEWSYDKRFDGLYCGKSLGKLCEAKSDNGYKRSHHYDNLGREQATATTLDSTSSPAVTVMEFDGQTGRVNSKIWPTGYKAQYTYNRNYLAKVTAVNPAVANAKQISYEILEMSNQDQVTKYKLGNNITTVKTYDDLSGRLLSQVATASGAATGNVQNMSYTWDSEGNLQSRSDSAIGGQYTETFAYDQLNRLRKSVLVGALTSPPVVTEVLYDARGNIVYKSDVGRYWYDPDRPNRMVQVSLETHPQATVAVTGKRVMFFAFDDYLTSASNLNGTTLGNGNLLYTARFNPVTKSQSVRTEEYTSYNMLKFMVLTATDNVETINPTQRARTDFLYGPEHQRIKQVVTGGSNPGTTWYLNGIDSQGLSFEKTVKANGLIEYKHYISAGDSAFAMFTSREGNLSAPSNAPAGTASLSPTTISYFHQDHLGSMVAVSDDLGAVVERMSYDAWGKRRYPNGAADPNDLITVSSTNRGYTMHEMMDDFDIINMNGRVYDPELGRFLSADPYIQDPSNLQSYNRYSYVMNNPLAFTDPSGYFSWSREWRNLRNTIKKVWREVKGVVLPAVASLVAGPWGVAIVMALDVRLSTGSWKGALRAGITSIAASMAFGAAGDVGVLDSFERYAAHAAAGCATALVGGGNGNDCARQAGAAVVGKFATNATDGLSLGARFIATALAGGVTSVISGGSFKDGAKTATYGFLFNHVTGIFKKSTGVLTLTDSDTGETVSEKFKSGGEHKTKSAPNGMYHILERGKIGYYSLEALDNKYGDDISSFTGEYSMSYIRLHKPGVTLGCVTAIDKEGWTKVNDLLSRTFTSQVSVISKNFFMRNLPGEARTNQVYYGLLQITD